jgi:hypothetical protein
VPLPTVWDARTVLAFLDCLRALQYAYVTVPAFDDHPTGSSSSSSSSSNVTIPPVTSALVSALLLVFTRPGGVMLRDVALSPYCVIDRKEYWRYALRRWPLHIMVKLCMFASTIFNTAALTTPTHQSTNPPTRCTTQLPFQRVKAQCKRVIQPWIHLPLRQPRARDCGHVAHHTSTCNT